MAQEPSTVTILAVDDDVNARKLITLLLEREGYRVITAAHGEEALILAKVQRPQVILLDIMMPKMNGYDALKRLRQDPDTKEIPVIMVTARGAEHDIAASFRLGAVFHVEKPYETKELVQKIRVAMRATASPSEEGG